MLDLHWVKDVRCPIKTVGEMFAIGQRSVQKVITGKLYDSEGRRAKSIFEQTQKHM